MKAHRSYDTTDDRPPLVIWQDNAECPVPPPPVRAETEENDQ